MLQLTPDKSNELRYLERQAQEIRAQTKEIELLEGPFHGSKGRIRKYFDHFATTLPADIAENYRPLEFDGVPDVPEPLTFVAVYSPMNDSKFVFEEIQVWKQTDEGSSFPLGHEKVKIK